MFSFWFKIHFLWLTLDVPSFSKRDIGPGRHPHPFHPLASAMYAMASSMGRYLRQRRCHVGKNMEDYIYIYPIYKWIILTMVTNIY